MAYWIRCRMAHRSQTLFRVACADVAATIAHDRHQHYGVGVANAVSGSQVGKGEEVRAWALGI
jgi:hypothetical protein